MNASFVDRNQVRFGRRNQVPFRARQVPARAQPQHASGQDRGRVVMAEGGYFGVPCSCFSGIHVHVSVFLRALASPNDYLPEPPGKCRMRSMGGGEQASRHGGRRSREGWISGRAWRAVEGINRVSRCQGAARTQARKASPDGRPIGSKTEVILKTLPSLEARLKNASCRIAFALCLCG
jgi:hypothetical protein